jgi:MarR family transcriptional regulator, organic hydroperoxide resistance regulator
VVTKDADKASKHVANMANRRHKIDDFVFADLDKQGFLNFTYTLALLKSRLEKACVKVALDL